MAVGERRHGLGKGQIARLSAAGVQAFLVGEALLRAADPAAKLRELAGE